MGSGREFRGGLVGCGFFAANHLHGWAEVDGARIVAVCDRDEANAREAAHRFGIEQVYIDMAEMMTREKLDFVDVVTQADSHRSLVELAAGHGVSVICQKPMAPTVEDGTAMVQACADAGVLFMVHENFRWQRPMQAVHLAARELGPLHFGRVNFRSGYDVYADQPYLAKDDRFIIYDLCIHLLDLSRFLMGETESIYSHTQRVNPMINGEDHAAILLNLAGGGVCIVDMSYASKLDEELFPQTLVHLEGRDGSVVLSRDYHITVTRDGQTSRQQASPHRYAWSTPPADLVQDSVVEIQRHWIECLRTGEAPATSGADNLRTLQLVFAAYRSAATNAVCTV